MACKSYIFVVYISERIHAEPYCMAWEAMTDSFGTDSSTNAVSTSCRESSGRERPSYALLSWDRSGTRVYTETTKLCENRRYHSRYLHHLRACQVGVEDADVSKALFSRCAQLHEQRLFQEFLSVRTLGLL